MLLVFFHIWATLRILDFDASSVVFPFLRCSVVAASSLLRGSATVALLAQQQGAAGRKEGTGERREGEESSDARQ